MNEIALRRLFAQRLAGEPLPNPVEVVRWLGAVQSQDYGGAKWAMAQRSRPMSDVELDRAFDAGSILRTHVLRPTWHFVAPADLREVLEIISRKIGVVMLVLGGMHFFNIFVFSKMRRRALLQAAPPPVPPQAHIPVVAQ